MWGPLPDVLDRVCTYYRDSVAIIDGDRSLTYQEMRDWRNQIANGLVELGVEKGERIGLLMPNVLEFIPCEHAIWAAGAVLVQMATRASASAFVSNLGSTEATTLIYHAKFEIVVAEIVDQLPALQRLIRVENAPAAGTQHAVDAVDFGALISRQSRTRPDVDIDEHDEAFIMFTSGSTGEPKGVVNSHFTWGYDGITAGLDMGDIAFGEVFAHGAPLTHFSHAFVMPTFIRGGTNVMLPALDVATLLSNIERHKVTATAVVPTIIYLLLDSPRRPEFDLSTLRTLDLRWRTDHARTTARGTRDLRADLHPDLRGHRAGLRVLPAQTRPPRRRHDVGGTVGLGGPCPAQRRRRDPRRGGPTPPGR